MVDQGAEPEGSGNVNGPVTNAGTIAPANFLTVGGSYAQTSTGALDTFTGARLSVTGTATLSGALNMAFNHRFPPPVGASFAAITYASHRGLFTTHTANFNLKVKPTEIDAVFQGRGAVAPSAVRPAASR